MKHATLRALAIVAARDSDVTPGINACGTGEQWCQVFGATSASYMNIEGGIGLTAREMFAAVDCPTCRVLLDAALEGRFIDVRKYQESTT